LEDQGEWWLSRRPSFGRLLAIAAITAMFSAAMAYGVYRGPEYGLPKNDQLTRTSGRVVSVELVHNRHADITLFSLDSSPTIFEFTVVMGDHRAVAHSLCTGCEASVWTEPSDQREYPFAWQIAVNGKFIAKYQDVKSNWIDNNRSAVWLGPLGGIATIVFLVWAFRRWRSDKKRNKMPAPKMDDN
jgi:hypothetical protein